MAKTVGFGKQERQMLSNARLPPDVRVAIIDFKNRIKIGRGLVPFENREGRLPELAAGQSYYEHQVGEAHQGDARRRGKRRLVALVDASQNVLRMYFSEGHYTRGVWMELQYP